MNKTFVKIVLWLSVIVWMGVIFWFSAQNASDSAELSGQTVRKLVQFFVRDFNDLPEHVQYDMVKNLEHLVRKAAHVTVFFILGILVTMALLQHEIKKRFQAALLICVLYAVSDEVHQIFVDGRGAQIVDVFIDSCGALAGICLVLLISRMNLIKMRITEILLLIKKNI